MQKFLTPPLARYRPLPICFFSPGNIFSGNIFFFASIISPIARTIEPTPFAALVSALIVARTGRRDKAPPVFSGIGIKFEVIQYSSSYQRFYDE